MFLIFVNDLTNRLSCPNLLFYVLNCNLSKFYDWTVSNNLYVNIDKCHVISYSKRPLHQQIQFDYKINGLTLDRVKSLTDLGVLFDSELKF